MIAMAGMLAGVLCFAVRQPVKRLLSIAALIIGYAYFVATAF